MLVEKTATGIFLMKESSKLYRPHKEREQRKLAKRLGRLYAGSSDSRQPQGQKNKCRTLAMGNTQRCLHRSKAMYR